MALYQLPVYSCALGAAETMGRPPGPAASLFLYKAGKGLCFGSGLLGHCQVPSTVIMGIQGLLKRNGAVGT